LRSHNQAAVGVQRSFYRAHRVVSPHEQWAQYARENNCVADGQQRGIGEAIRLNVQIIQVK
jgi:hypothetical protein